VSKDFHIIQLIKDGEGPTVGAVSPSRNIEHFTLPLARGMQKVQKDYRISSNELQEGSKDFLSVLAYPGFLPVMLPPAPRERGHHAEDFHPSFS
jgi:hypothetical protein